VGGLGHAIQQMISAWYLNGGYLGIVLAMAIESCCIPLPSEIVMPLAGFFVVQYPQRFSLLGVAVAGAAGCLLGSAAAYWIGRSGGRPLLLRYGRYVLISQADSDRADRLFARHGNVVTFFSRLLPVVRTYISLPAGIARMDFTRFSVYTLLGSLPWCLALAWVGTKLGENSSQLATIFHGLDVVIVAVVIAAVALYVWRHIRHDSAARAQQAAAGAGTGSPARRRARPIPASPLDTPERPTLQMERISAWPNRFARPGGTGKEKGAPSGGQPLDASAEGADNRPRS
jgi:membrane protein DedA with SNARE-associated domain